MDIQEVLHDREVFLKALWYFEGNADLPVVKMQRIRYQNSRAEFLKHRDYIRTMARLRATESALGNTNEELERTAAALVAAEAEVARLRAALEKFTDDTSDVAFLLTDVLVGFNSLKWQEISEQYSLDDVRDSIKAARHTLFAKAVVARAALNPEATHENG